MRISTVTIFDQNVNSMNRQQAEFMKIGQQLASGKRVVNPSDDPQAAARAIDVGQSIAANEQYKTARVSVRNSLGQQESIVNSANEIVIRAKTLMIQASSDTMSEIDRLSISSEIEGLYEAMIGLGNSTDGSGRYTFGGYADGRAPFERAGDGTVVFAGSQDVREERVDGDRFMKVGHTGFDVFLTSLSNAKPTSEPELNSNVFRTFEKAIAALSDTAGAIPENEKKVIFADVMRELDNSQDNLLTKRASLGARLNELDTLDLVAGNRNLSYQQTMSELVDLDYVQASADYSLRMVGLQAAQKAFVDIKGLSLFNYLR
ncbi:flagellar hook-filament junction protein FlgL [Aliidiomarina halalkaliphila]|uniref:Flagellar hook-filament junction protein FlgL n=1 Tax=Aliidiomarina halalkaliphila TaxID=2593535 RepID=A0A552X189_9GAMM|nr:flagellar hook-associated protein FlgL [Aliidiomarina halalkaliphila]TRW48812.1 flagellar hook-filament junction protein FlgL [Aliidiomarina halalkaliphila]